MTSPEPENQLLGEVAKALRREHYPDMNRHKYPPHIVHTNVHIKSFKRFWFYLGRDVVNMAITEYEKGYHWNGGPYDPEDDLHAKVARWLWWKSIQRTLDSEVALRNHMMTAKDQLKVGVRSMVRLTAYQYPEFWKGKRCLLLIPGLSFYEQKQMLGGWELFEYVEREFDEEMERVCEELCIYSDSIAYREVWDTFEVILEHLESSDSEAENSDSEAENSHSETENSDSEAENSHSEAENSDTDAEDQDSD
ncbi:hypothetical protein NP233_g5930 [Leucocoprinus birnbaumii]|uniref:Uncharacterized protein n=1 Tax=Leucocoprinus birnbaumii TaxID=56174 RepID=A0AAD5YW03_9AGAR|nr:hypothetical protein NP233_g5930 [Leucocoprinus birnbaumii]